MFTFTHEQLEQFLLNVVTSFAGEDGVYDFSRVEDNTRQVVINRAIATLEASQPYWEKEGEFETHIKWLAENKPEWLKTAFDASNIPNSVSAIDEDEDPDWWIEDSQATEHLRLIPFDGQPIPHETDDNISPAELGLQPVA